MIRRAPGCFRSDPVKSQLRQAQAADKDVDHPNGIILVDPVFQAFRKQRALPTIRALNEAPHPIPPQIAAESYSANQITECVFTQARSKADVTLLNFDVRFAPESGHPLTMFALPVLAKEVPKLTGTAQL